MGEVPRHPIHGTVVRTIERPAPEVIAQLNRCYTGLVLDHLGKVGAMHMDIGVLAPGMRVCGPAVTSLGPDLTVRRMAIDLAEPGDVLVVAAGGVREYACFGDGTARRMQVKGIAGAIIDGATRDAAGLRRIGFPTWARGCTPRNYHYPEGGEYGAVNVSVICGGVRVHPGDLILADDDGVIVIPRDEAPRLAGECVEHLLREQETRGAWRAYPPFAVEDELRARGYDVG